MGREIPKLRVLTKEELLNVRNGDILYDHTGGRWKITSHIHGSPYLPDATVKAEMVALAQKYQFPDSLVENPDRYDENMAEKLTAIFRGTELFGGPDTDIDTKARSTR